MWWGRSRRAQVYVGRRRVFGCGTAGQRFAFHYENLNDAFLKLGECCAAHRLQQVHLLLGGACVRMELISPIEGTRSLDEAEVACGALLRADGRAVDGESVRLSRVHGRDAGWPCFVASEALLDVIAKPIPGIRVMAAEPWWVAVMNRRMVGAGSHGAIAAFDGEALSWLDFGGGTKLMDAMTLVPVPDTGAAQRAVRRMQAARSRPRVLCAHLHLAAETTAEDPEVGRGGNHHDLLLHQVSIGEQFAS